MHRGRLSSVNKLTGSRAADLKRWMAVARAISWTRFQQMSRVGMSQQVRVNVFFDVGLVRGKLAGIPDDLRSNRFIGTPVVDGTWEQPSLRSHPAPVFPQGLQQLGTQRDIAITSTLAVLNMDEHGLAIDVFDLQVAHFAIPHASGVEHHRGPKGCELNQSVVQLPRQSK